MLDSATSSAAQRQSGAGLFCLVLSGVLWGTGGLLGSLLNRTADLSSMAVACYRLSVGGILIVFCLFLIGRRWPTGRAAWTRVVVIGLLTASFQGCYFAAVAQTSVSLATLVTIGSVPLLVLVAELVSRRRQMDRSMFAILGLALPGLGLLVGFPTGELSLSTVLAGAGLSVLSAAGFAAITMVGTTPVPGLDDLTTTGFGFCIGGLALMPLAASTSGLGFIPTPTTLGLLFALGTAPTAVAYTLYFRGLRTIVASTAAVLALLEPLTGAVLAALVLGDRLGSTGMIGAALLAAAVVLAARTSHR